VKMSLISVAAFEHLPFNARKDLVGRLGKEGWSAPAQHPDWFP
jgi:hypothetical protein